MYIVFDTECYKNRVMVLCAYFVEKGIIKTYTEGNLQEFAKFGNGENKFIGFNIFDFDYKMLNKYFDTTGFKVKSLDILQKVKEMEGRGYSLDKLASATLGLHKNGDGFQAIKWFRVGDIRKVVDYCKNDVYLTYKLYEFGKRNNFLYVPSTTGLKKQIKVYWQDF
jgi:DEAD/DEAH box helicase domain-containing protein